MGFFGEFDSFTNLIKKILIIVNSPFSNGKKKKCGYYFSELNKKVFVTKDGNGVIISSFDFIALNSDDVTSFERQLEISDAKKSTELPPFSEMTSGKKKSLFTDFKFWYRSEDGIISSVEEYYGEDDANRMEDRKFIGLKFIVDKGKLTEKKKYRIVYGFSIPGLYPIAEGKFDESEKPYSPYGFSSTMDVKHLSKKARIAIYFEDGIQTSKTPICFAKPKSKGGKSINERSCERRDNLIYQKYLFELDNPEAYGHIGIKWNIKH